MATVTHKVVWGDTLSALARRYNTTVTAIAKLNNIANVNRIYVGQVLYISGKPATSSTSSGSTTSSSGASTASQQNNATITMFGLQSDTERTIFAVWTWGKTNTEKYIYEWDYQTKNNVWFNGSHSELSSSNINKESTYSAPSNATRVRFRVKPISKTYKSGNNDVNYWTAAWTGFKEYDMNSLPPGIPPTPTVEVNDYTLKARVENLNVNATEIEFEVVKNDNSVFTRGTSTIVTNTAAHAFTINVGDTYKVRARSKRGSVYSGYSNYSSNLSTKPSAPTGITKCQASSKTSVSLAWNKVNTADDYEIEYATKKEYLDGSNATTKVGGILTTQYEVTGLNMGERYFFRVRANNSKGNSAWTAIVSVVIGTKPSAPTTWSSTSTVIAAEDLTLYWVHNSEDQSKETFAEIEVYTNNVKNTYIIENKNPDDDPKTGQYILNTKSMSEGAVVKWRVRTSGITKEYGDWSVQRTVDVYAPPTLNLEILDNAGKPLNVLNSFPFYIKGVAGPSTQTPISFHVAIISKQTYETVDEVGRVKTVISGEEVYSKFYDISVDLMLELMPGSVDLQNDITYDIVCTVAMNSGLSTSVTNQFTVSWIDDVYIPNAEIFFDKSSVVTYIRPFCEYYPDIYYKVEYIQQAWVKTDIVISKIDGISVDDSFTDEDDVVYAGMYNNVLTHFCIRPSTTPIPLPGMTFSVYRREFDGSYTEIGTNLPNLDNIFVTDPHPALDYARYRIVAISDATGSVSYTDLPPYPIGEKAIIIQWNEEWADYDTTDVGTVAEPTWSGSLLRLPYNVDTSEKNNVDITLIPYIGRSNPVSYYGTQLGSTANWSVAIPRYDVDTIYALRRLSIWLGDVYVREPSGTGYWATVSVSFSQTHTETVIPVSLTITRVEGGV